MMDNFERKNTDLDYINKIYRYIKNDMSVEEFMCKFRVSFNELKGILELCNIYGKDVDIVVRDGTLYFVKNSIFGAEIGVKAEGFSNMAILATILAIGGFIIMYITWRV